MVLIRMYLYLESVHLKKDGGQMKKKEMNKKEILERLVELQKLLNMPQEELINMMNEKYISSRSIKEDDYYPYMVGWVKSEIDYILEGGF